MQFDFDATQYDPTQQPSALPVSDSKGWPVIIIASQPKPTKDSAPENPAWFLELMLQIIDGPYKGVTGADRLNLCNANQEAVDIAYKRLSAYCHVLGKYRIGRTEELHNQPLRVIVEQQKKNPEYTQITKILDINGNEPHKAGQGPAPAATAPAPGNWQGQPQQTAGAPQPQWGPPAPPASAPADQPASVTTPWAAGAASPPVQAPWNKQVATDDKTPF
jgi:hypothetical protein